MVSLIYTYNSFVQNNLFRETYLDMRPFIERVLNDCKRGFYRKSELSLDMVIKSLWFGIQERLKGAYLSIEDSEPSYPPYRGGLQRVIKALEVPILFSLGLAGEPWSGFVTIGEESEFRHIYSLLNLPMERALHPPLWWGLSHEMSHVITFFKNIIKGYKEENDSELRKKLKEFLVKDLDEFYRTNRRLLNEIATDLIDFTCFFLNDWHVYKHQVLNHYLEYFKRQDVADLDRGGIYLLRLLCTYAYFLCFIKRQLSERDLNNKTTIRKLVNQILGPNKSKFFKEHTDDERAITETIDTFLRIYKFLSVVHVRMFKSSWFRKMSKRKKIESNTKKVLLSLKKGEIWFMQITDPWLVLYAQLRRDENMLFKEEIATILTLWHQYATFWAKKIKVY